jgi:hypothetical protein
MTPALPLPASLRGEADARRGACRADTLEREIALAMPSTGTRRGSDQAGITLT